MKEFSPPPLPPRRVTADLSRGRSPLHVDLRIKEKKKKKRELGPKDSTRVWRGVCSTMPPSWQQPGTARSSLCIPSVLAQCSTGTPGAKGKGRAGGASKGDFLKGKHASRSQTDGSFLITSPELPYKASLPRCTTPPDCPSVSPSCPGCTRPSCTFHPKPQKWKYSWPGSRHGWISGVIMDFKVRGTVCVQ